MSVIKRIKLINSRRQAQGVPSEILLVEGSRKLHSTGQAGVRFQMPGSR
jgi:hypothetical protein